MCLVMRPPSWWSGRCISRRRASPRAPRAVLRTRLHFRFACAVPLVVAVAAVLAFACAPRRVLCVCVCVCVCCVFLFFFFCSIAGHSEINRCWFVNSFYGGCNVDAGWLVVASRDATACAWEEKWECALLLYNDRDILRSGRGRRRPLLASWARCCCSFVLSVLPIIHPYFRPGYYYYYY